MKGNTFYIIVFCLLFTLFELSGKLFAQTAADSSKVVSGDTIPSPAAVVPPATLVDTGSKSTAAKPQDNSVISMSFVKEKVEHGPDSTFFNILKISNNNGKPVNGIVRISVPVGWKIISNAETSVSILPGTSEYVPIRVSLSRNVTGGVSYLINATLLSDRSLFPDKNQTSLTKPCYVTIPEKTRWDIFPVSRTVYFDRYTEYAPFYVKLVNKGNGNQLVKLEFDIGNSLEMYGAIGSKHFASFEMKPNRDTIITYNVKYIPPDESSVWDRNLRKLSIRIVATSDTIVKKTSVNFKYLESTYRNVLASRVSPLNIDVQLQNLLSEVPPRLSFGAYGNIFFKNDHTLDYFLRFPSIPFSGYDKPGFAERLFWRNARMQVHYRTDRWEAAIGDVGFSGVGMIGVGGRGVSGSYRINDKHEVGAALTTNIGLPIYSGGLSHNTTIKKRIGLSSSVTFNLNDYNKMNQLGAATQVSLRIADGHRVTLLIAGSQTRHLYDNQTFKDPSGNFITTTDPGATFLGLGSQLKYSLNLRKVRANFNASFASRHFSQYYNGQFGLNGNGQYTINKKYYIAGHSNYRIYDPLIYNKGIVRPDNKLVSGGHKLDFANKLNSRVTFFMGPQLDHVRHEQMKKTTLGDTTYTRFSSISPKATFRLHYRNNFNSSVTPSFALGRTYITRAEDSTLANTTIISRRSFFNATAGLNFVQNDWGVNVFYYYGPHSIVTQTDYYYFNSYSKSLRIMPYFQKYFFNRTMLLRSYNSYHYDATANNERINLNATLSFFLEHSWTFYVDNNLFLLSRISNEGEKIYSRAYYLSLGLKKSFDIPQPGIKYYDLKVICFKDINGNSVLDDNEQGLSEIVIVIDRNAKTDSVTMKPVKLRGQFVPAEMVTDNFGQVIYYEIPEGEFNISVYPLQNLKDIFNIKGQKQSVNVTKDTTYYIPFVQTYRVNGNVIVNRDEYSSTGAVSTANIRITASDSLGNSYPTLTASDGSYAVYVPQAGKYKVTINNVFGDQFFLQESEYEVSFDGAKEFHVDFIFNEKKRQINIAGGGAPTIAAPTLTNTVAPTPAPTNTTSATKPSALIIAGNDTLKDAKIVTDAGAKTRDSSIPVGPGISYRIQLAASSKQVIPSQYEIAFKGIQNIQEYSEAGIYKYTAGDLQTIEEAKKLKDEARAKGFKDAFIVPFYKGTRVKY